MQLATLMGITVCLSLAAAVLFDRPFLQQSLFALSNLVGPTTWSLLHGGGLTVCTTEMGTPGNPICFHAGRMLVPSLVIATGVRLFGDSFLRVAIFKTVLFLLPIECSIWLVWSRRPRALSRQMVVALLLVAPFVMTPFLANVVNLQVEEGYAYSLIALATAILFFGPAASVPAKMSANIWIVVAFALAADALYLSKSSMILAVLVLTIAFFLQQRSVAGRVLLVVLVAAAPVGWMLHQHHASGRYSLGTSLDGINLHKANVATFLDHYPPQAGSSLDQYDADLNRNLSFRDEWSFNDFHQRAAFAYMRRHPGRTLAGDGRKLWVVFFSLTKYGSSVDHGWKLAVGKMGLLLFRVILWAAIGCGLFALFRPSSANWSGAGVAFLALVVACVLPYVAGFAYTRHASILVYPACLMCCRVLCGTLAEE